MRRIIFTLIGCLLLIVPAVAQTAEDIAIGETRRGAVTAENVAPTYFFNGAANQTLTVRLNILTEGFVPLGLIADANNTLIGSINSAPGLTSVYAIVTLRTDGLYQVQVQGVEGSTGEFEISVLEGDISLTPSPTPLPQIGDPTVTPSLTPTAEITGQAPAPVNTPDPNRFVIDVGRELAGLVSAETPTQIYSIPPAQIARTIILVTDSNAEPPSAALELAATGEVIAAMSAPVFGGSFYVPAGDFAFILRVSHDGGAPSTYRVSVRPIAPLTLELGTGDLVLATNTPQVSTSITAQPTAEPTVELTASDVDLIVRWTSTQFVLTNVSGEPADIHDLGFAGTDGRQADANYWDRTGTVNVFALPSGSCLGLRPLAYPDAPARPADCDDLAAWWASDTLVFWYGDSFDVTFNREVIQTCLVPAGQCFIDLPNL